MKANCTKTQSKWMNEWFNLHKYFNDSWLNHCELYIEPALNHWRQFVLYLYYIFISIFAGKMGVTNKRTSNKYGNSMVVREKVVKPENFAQLPYSCQSNAIYNNKFSSLPFCNTNTHAQMARNGFFIQQLLHLCIRRRECVSCGIAWNKCRHSWMNHIGC